MWRTTDVLGPVLSRKNFLSGSTQGKTMLCFPVESQPYAMKFRRGIKVEAVSKAERLTSEAE
jgi:hypothetical protein